MKYYLFTIYNNCTENNEHFYLQADIKSDLEAFRFLNDYLAENCFCDSWEFVGYEETNEEYNAKRENAVNNYFANTGRNFDDDFLACATLEQIEESVLYFANK